MQPDQKAQARQPYTIDIFTTIQAETNVTFARTNDKVTISAPGIQAHEMSAATFDQYFKYYKQADLFQSTPTPAGKLSDTAAKLLKILQNTGGAWENSII